MLELSNDKIEILVAPEVGARITSFVDRESGYQFLWRNPRVPLRREEPGSDYDPNFFGGIDELFPNDVPETICGVGCPDHGELWTTSFDLLDSTTETARLRASFPLSGFQMEKELALDGSSCAVTSTLRNRRESPFPFLWKLHAALAIQPGDLVECPATGYIAADPEWSRRKGSGPWHGEVVPEFDNSTEFLFLHGLDKGEISWRRGGKSFTVEFDAKVFRYAWYFASYGGFDGHEVAILEPCTCMPLSVNEANQKGQCSVLKPGQELKTTYRYRGLVHED